MNNREYLLVCLLEELSETQKEIAKCLRFTPQHISPHDNMSNIARVGLEYADTLAIIELLEEAGIQIPVSVARIAEKKERTKQLMATSRKLGALR